MLSDAVKQMQERKKAVLAQITGLNAEVRALDKTIARAKAVDQELAALKLTTPVAAKTVKPSKARRKMSPLGRLKIKLGSLNRYGKKEEAKKVQAQIAALEGKAPALPPLTAAAKPAKKKFVMSPAHKAALKKAQAARWAKVKAAKK